MRIIALLLFFLMLQQMSGCSATLSAPENVHTPREIQLLQHNRHSSLLLTTDDQSRLRFSFGDWAWYVENQHSLVSGSQALLQNSKGALGKQRIAPKTANENLEAKTGVIIDQAYVFQVDADKVDALITHLEELFSKSPAPPLYRAERHLSFVPHTRPYSYRYNSNHQVADWLRALGLQVNGNPAWGNWRVNADFLAAPQND